MFTLNNTNDLCFENLREATSRDAGEWQRGASAPCLLFREYNLGNKESGHCRI